MTGFGFHAAPLAGHWINDPNGLVFSAGRYRLFVQHRADAPHFVVTGWARFSSDDLLRWEWDGEVLAASHEGFAYSGSIVADAAGSERILEAWHTRHRTDGDPRERQFVAQSHNGGLSWSVPAGPHGPEGRNARDPFVFDLNGARHMLLARPRDWFDAKGKSRIEMASQCSNGEWSPAVDLGLGISSDLLCEMPNLLRFGENWALLASFVDRSAGGAASWTGYWLGTFRGDRFVPDQPAPTRLDLGPDFYAAIANLDAGWPAERMLIGWASSWGTARQLAVPGGGSGGAISMPRSVGFNGSVLNLAPIPSALRHGQIFSWLAGATLTIRSDEAELIVDLRPGLFTATRNGSAGWNWTGKHHDARIHGDLMLFLDANLVELFIGGIAMTVVLPGRDHCIAWNVHNGS